MSVLSPNMNLLISTIGVDSGLTWEQNINASLGIIDSHSHAPGSGVQIQPSGINISADLPFNSNNATLLRSSRYASQSSPLALSSDLNCVYAVNGNLYYNDGSGNQIQITSGGAVNATSSGIASGTATASFSGGKLVVNAASNTPADIQCASLLIGLNALNTNYLTLSPPSPLSNNYSVVLPQLPGSTTSLLSMDTSGNMYASTALPSAPASTSYLVMTSGGAFETSMKQANVVVSSSSGSFTTDSTVAVDITNNSVTITTSGNPVLISIQNDGSGNPSEIGSDAGSGTIRYLNRGSTTLSSERWDTANSDLICLPVAFTYIDQPSAGTYTYTLQMSTPSSGVYGYHTYTKLVAYELV